MCLFSSPYYSIGYVFPGAKWFFSKKLFICLSFLMLFHWHWGSTQYQQNVPERYRSDVPVPNNNKFHNSLDKMYIACNFVHESEAKLYIR